MNIKELRQEAGLTQKQLADLLNVKQNTVSYWEQDKTTPDNNTIGKIADLFHVTTGYVLGLEEDRPNPRIIAYNLQHLMNQYGKDANEVCEDLGFDRPDFESWISGDKIPDHESFEKLQDYFCASPTFLVNDHHFNRDFRDNISPSSQSQDFLNFTDINFIDKLIYIINYSFHSSIFKIIERAEDMEIIPTITKDFHAFDKEDAISSLNSLLLQSIAQDAFNNAIESNNSEFLTFCYDELLSIPISIESTLGLKKGSLLYDQLKHQNKPE